MSLPMLAELPAVLLPFAKRAEQSFRDAVAKLDGDNGLSEWTPQRWADFARVCAASDFVIEQSVRDPLMLLELVARGELDRSFAPDELCGQIAAAVRQAETEDELGRVLRRQRTRQQVRIIWRDLTRQADLSRPVGHGRRLHRPSLSMVVPAPLRTVRYTHWPSQRRAAADGHPRHGQARRRGVEPVFGY